MVNFIRRSIKAQVLFLFSVIFIFNAIAVTVVVNSWSQNSISSTEVKDAISQSQEIIKITSSHIEWVSNLGSAISEGTEFTGSLDPTSCLFGKWVAELDDDLKNDSKIAGAIEIIHEPHDLIHGKAGELIKQSEINKEAAYDSYEKIILPNVLIIIDKLNIIADRCVTLAVESSEASTEMLQRNSVIQIGIIGLVLIMSVIIALAIIKLTVRPTVRMTQAAELLAKGELNIQIDVKSDNEMGRMADALGKAIGLIKSYIRDIDDVMRELSQRNFKVSTSGDFIGDFAGIQTSINSFIGEMTNTLVRINASAEQVSSGSDLVSNSSSTLSQGATEQASSVQQLTASLREVASQTTENAKNAQNANEAAKLVKDNAADGNEQMKEMLKAMDEINKSSASINKIIKVIDDIAFQTNILALNAAVEAARAGEHGKGFAVVAEEVRTLAARSAQAAKETTDLIEGSIGKVENGAKIANQTASALSSIVTEVDKAADLIESIAIASNDQAVAIDQINQGIMQVSSVVQNNAATAEESAAASEELSSQAVQLKEIIHSFRIRDNATNSQVKENAHRAKVTAGIGKS